MKTSVIASMLLASMAMAAPLERRARLTKTEIITITVCSTTTIYDDEPTPAATSSQGLFYEQPPPSAAAAPTSTPAPVPSVQTPAPSPAAPAPAVTSAAPVAPAQPSIAPPAASSAAAPAPAQPSTPSYSPSSSGSYQYTNVDLTVYNGYGAKGACATVLNDSDMFAALSKGIFGDATYDRMTGDPTNPWCKATIQVSSNGKTVTVPVVDRCAGCGGADDVDLSPAAWTALGYDPAAGGRYKASWNKVS